MYTVCTPFLIPHNQMWGHRCCLLVPLFPPILIFSHFHHPSLTTSQVVPGTALPHPEAAPVSPHITPNTFCPHGLASFTSLDSRSVEKASSLSLSLSLWQHHLGPGHDAYFCLKMSVFWFLKGKDVRAAFTLLGWERFSLVLHSPFRLLPITWRTALAVCSLPVLHKHVCQTLLFFLFPSYLILNITFSHLLGASVLVWSLYKSLCAQVCTGFK